MPRHEELTDRQLQLLHIEWMIKMTQASDALVAALNDLAPKVDQLIALEAAGNQDPVFTAATTQVQGIAAKVDAVLNPPPVEVEPAPVVEGEGA